MVEEGGGGRIMPSLSVYSKRLKVKDNWVGLDERFWLRIVEHKRWFRKPYYTIELILSNRENNFRTFDLAKSVAMSCLTDLHGLIDRREESK